MRPASFHLKYHRPNLHAEFFFVRIGLSLAGRGRVRDREGFQEQPLGINGSVRAPVWFSDLLLDEVVPSGSHCSGLAVTADAWRGP